MGRREKSTGRKFFLYIKRGGRRNLQQDTFLPVLAKEKQRGKGERDPANKFAQERRSFSFF